MTTHVFDCRNTLNIDIGQLQLRVIELSVNEFELNDVSIKGIEL